MLLGGSWVVPDATRWYRALLAAPGAPESVPSAESVSGVPRGPPRVLFWFQMASKAGPWARQAIAQWLRDEARRPNAMVEHSAEGKYRRRVPPSGEAPQARGACRQGRLRS